MGCAQNRQPIITQAYALELLAEGRYEKALKVLASIPSDSIEDINRISQIMIDSFQILTYNNKQIEQFLEKRFAINSSEKQRTRIAFLLANILSKLNLLEKAALWCSKVIQIDPKHQRSYILLAETLQKLQRYEEIVPLLETGHKIFPQDKEIIEKICSFCESVDQFEKAAEFYEKLIILQPNDYLHYYQYVNNDLQSSNYHIVKSQNYLFEGQKLEGKQGYMFLYLYAYLCYRCQSYTQAEETANSSIKINDLFKPSYYLLQKIYFATDNIKAEQKILLKMLILYPNSKKLQNRLASFYWRLEQYDSAAKIVQQILQNPDDTQIISTYMVAKVFYYSGQPKKAEEYFFYLLKRCKTTTQRQPIYTKIVDMHYFNSNWLMAYHYTCIRDKDIEIKLSHKIALASFCFKLRKNEEFLSLVDEIQRKIDVLYSSQIISFMQVIYQAKRYDQCLFIYDTRFIASKTKLKPTNQLKLNIVMTKCFYQLGKMDDFMEIVVDLQSLVNAIHQCPMYLIEDYMDICNKVWNYERLRYLYDVFVAKVNSRKINGYNWGEIRYQGSLKKYREILLEEESRIASTPK